MKEYGVLYRSFYKAFSGTICTLGAGCASAFTLLSEFLNDTFSFLLLFVAGFFIGGLCGIGSIPVTGKQDGCC